MKNKQHQKTVTLLRDLPINTVFKLTPREDGVKNWRDGLLKIITLQNENGFAIVECVRTGDTVAMMACVKVTLQY